MVAMLMVMLLMDHGDDEDESSDDDSSDGDDCGGLTPYEPVTSFTHFSCNVVTYTLFQLNIYFRIYFIKL